LFFSVFFFFFITAHIFDTILVVATCILIVPGIIRTNMYYVLSFFQILRLYKIVLCIPPLRALAVRIMGAAEFRLYYSSDSYALLLSYLYLFSQEKAFGDVRSIFSVLFFIAVNVITVSAALFQYLAGQYSVSPFFPSFNDSSSAILATVQVPL
jgi:hypothetical protein